MTLALIQNIFEPWFNSNIYVHNYNNMSNVKKKKEEEKMHTNVYMINYNSYLPIKNI